MDRKTQEQLIDKLKDYKGPESFWGESGAFSPLKKKIIERIFQTKKAVITRKRG